MHLPRWWKGQRSAWRLQMATNQLQQNDMFYGKLLLNSLEEAFEATLTTVTEPLGRQKLQNSACTNHLRRGSAQKIYGSLLHDILCSFNHSLFYG